MNQSHIDSTEPCGYTDVGSSLRAFAWSLPSEFCRIKPGCSQNISSLFYSSLNRAWPSLSVPLYLNILKGALHLQSHIHLSTMTRSQVTKTLLANAHVAKEIFELRPDYRVLFVVIEGITPGPSDEASEALLQESEACVKDLLSKHPVTEIPHIAAWRETYKSFGAKPQKTQNSLEALMRRAKNGLPRVNRLTDIYNAISIKHQIPFGGEDLDKYNGSPFLIRATGEEQFQTFSSGEPTTELTSPGEPIWCDDTGVTCRRWNWRQGPRTALSDDTTRVLFILDALEPLSDEVLLLAADELASELRRSSPDLQVSQRLIGASI
jgi:DNA/RNA-binding domain of Phe-tRNA-synthetase-like protein